MNPDFEKMGGLIPAIVQHAHTLQVLMLGYMSREALEQTRLEGKVTFFSRSKNRLWTKGETSGDFLRVQDIRLDCDGDALLIMALPDGPVCHTGSFSCFQEQSAKGFLHQLEYIIRQRIAEADPQSYTHRIYAKGINKIAQKVGEEAVELIIEAKDDSDELFANEAADLLYHLLILLAAKKTTLQDIEAVLLARHK